MRLLVALTMVVAATAWAQVNVNMLTRLEVQEAARFTDGVVMDCPLNSYDPAEVWPVCVDTSATRWSQRELMQWADYGLSDWRVYESWRDEGDYVLLTLVHPQRRELLLVAVSDGGTMVVYTLVPLGE